MIVIKTVSEKYFSINGIAYAKIYQPLVQGEFHIGIYNVKDSRHQLLESTRFTEIEINGVVYGEIEEAVSGILDVVFNSDLGDVYAELSNKVNKTELVNLEGVVLGRTEKGGYSGTTQDLKDELDAKSFEGVLSYQTKALLDAVNPIPVDGSVAKVVNDGNVTLNGYYSVSGGSWLKDSTAGLTDEVDELNDFESTSGKAVYNFYKNKEFKHSSEISKDLTEVLRGDFNRTVFNRNDLVSASRVTSNGTTVSASTVMSTGFIKLNNAYKVLVSMVVSSVDVGLAFYEEEDESTFVSFESEDGSTDFNLREYSIPVNANYLKTTFWRESYELNDVSFYLKLIGVDESLNSVGKNNLIGQFRLILSSTGFINYEDGRLRFKSLYLIDGASGKRLFLNDGVNAYNESNEIEISLFDSVFISIRDFYEAGANTEIQIRNKTWTGLGSEDFDLGVFMSLTDVTFMAGVVFDLISKREIKESKTEIEVLNKGLLLGNIINEDSLLDEGTVIDGNEVGIFELRFVDDDNSVEKIKDEDEDFFRINLDSSSGGNPAFWALNEIDVGFRGGEMILEFDVKSEVSDSFVVNTDGNNYEVNSSVEWVRKSLNIVFGSLYGDMRLMFYKASSVVFDIKNISLRSRNIVGVVESNSKDIKVLKSVNKNNSEFGLFGMANYRNKISSINLGNDESLVIGLHGDSWTHKIDEFSRYTTFIARYLREKYGNGGGGFYDFSASSGDQFMKSIDELDATDSRSGTVNYIDEGSAALGVNCSHAEFNTGSSISLDVLTNHEKFIIHYFAGASYGSFRYRIDGGSWVVVDVSLLEGYQIIEEVVLDDVHLIDFEIVSGVVILFGVDMQRDTGVRVHKLGNRGLKASDVLAVDAENWKDSISALNLDCFTTLLGTNDRTTSVSLSDFKVRMKYIFDKVNEAEKYIDFCFISPSNNRSSASIEMIEYSNVLYELAVENDCAFISLIPLFGSREKLTSKGFFNDSVHPTISGGKAIQELINEKLFF